MTDRVVLDHPVVVAALAHHGVTPAWVEASPLWRGLQTVDITSPGPQPGPSTIALSRTSAHISWLDVPTEMVFDLDRTRAGWAQTLTIRRRTLPETALAASVGRRLADVVALEGCAGMRIVAVRTVQDGVQEFELTPHR